MLENLFNQIMTDDDLFMIFASIAFALVPICFVLYSNMEAKKLYLDNETL